MNIIEELRAAGPEVRLVPGEVAALAGVTVRTVERWADSGRLTVERTSGRHRRFFPAEVAELLVERNMTTYYKAVRPDGTDFRTGTVQWAPPADHEGEWVVAHPRGVRPDAGPTDLMEAVLCASTEPADCTGFKWPCRLLLVEPVEGSGFHKHLRHKVRGTQFRVIGERPAHEALGPNGEQAAAFLALCGTLTDAQWDEVADVYRRSYQNSAAWDADRAAARAAARAVARDATRAAAWDVAGDVAVDAARAAARDAARAAAWAAAWAAVRGYVVRDLIPEEQFETLVAPFREAGIDLPCYKASGEERL